MAAHCVSLFISLSYYIAYTEQPIARCTKYCLQRFKPYLFQTRREHHSTGPTVFGLNKRLGGEGTTIQVLWLDVRKVDQSRPNRP